MSTKAGTDRKDGRDKLDAIIGGCGGRQYTSVQQIRELIRQFEATTLPKVQWTHAAHLTVALWYLLGAPHDAAARRIRQGITRYNASKGVASTPTGGYHETITLFWIKIVSRHLEEHSAAESIVELANGLIQKAGNKELLLEYYSRERLFSDEARFGWMEPDLKPL